MDSAGVAWNHAVLPPQGAMASSVLSAEPAMVSDTTRGMSHGDGMRQSGDSQRGEAFGCWPAWSAATRAALRPASPLPAGW